MKLTTDQIIERHQLTATAHLGAMSATKQKREQAAEAKRLRAENPDLAEFTPSTIKAILSEQRVTKREEFGKRITEGEWLRYNFVGRKQIEKLRARGWVAPGSDPKRGVSVRLSNVFDNLGMEVNSLNALRILYGIEDKSMRVRNVGKRTMAELCVIAGMDMPQPARAWRFDPWTGKRRP